MQSATAKEELQAYSTLFMSSTDSAYTYLAFEHACVLAASPVSGAAASPSKPHTAIKLSATGTFKLLEIMSKPDFRISMVLFNSSIYT